MALGPEPRRETKQLETHNHPDADIWVKQSDPLSHSSEASATHVHVLVHIVSALICATSALLYTGQAVSQVSQEVRHSDHEECEQAP